MKSLSVEAKAMLSLLQKNLLCLSMIVLVSACSPEQETMIEKGMAASKAKDHEQAREWYMKALTDQNTARTVQMLVEAAKSNDPEAQYRLGKLYIDGNKNLSANKPLAEYWLREAVQLGHIAARYELSDMYAMGNGVEKDPLLAYILLKLPKGKNETEASRYVSERLDQFTKLLSVKQIEAAKVLASGWQAGDPLPESLWPKKNPRETEASRYVTNKLNQFQDLFVEKSKKAGKDFNDYLTSGDISSFKQIAADSKSQETEASRYVTKKLEGFQDIFMEKLKKQQENLQNTKIIP